MAKGVQITVKFPLTTYMTGNDKISGASIREITEVETPGVLMETQAREQCVQMRNNSLGIQKDCLHACLCINGSVH